MRSNILYELFIICIMMAVIGSGYYTGSRWKGAPRSGHYLAFLGSAWWASALLFNRAVVPMKLKEPQLDFAMYFTIVLLAIGLWCLLWSSPRQQK